MVKKKKLKNYFYEMIFSLIKIILNIVPGDVVVVMLVVTVVVMVVGVLVVRGGGPARLYFTCYAY